MNIATWNVNSLNVRLPHVLQWLETHQPDVLALQEIKLVDEKFPLSEINAAGYQAIFSGQKTYNGVAILSKIASTEMAKGIANYVDEQQRVLAATINDIRVINVYVPNGQSVDSDKYHYKLTWLEHLHAYLTEQIARYPKLVILGDFNIAPGDEDVHDPVLWEGQVLCSEPERMALQKLCSAGLTDSFRLFAQPEKSFSWWDYRAAGFRRNLGLRIDHILVTEALAKTCKQVIIDKVPRGWERPSDHAPVMAEFAI